MPEHDSNLRLLIYRVVQKKWTTMQSVNIIYVKCCSTVVSFLSASLTLVKEALIEIGCVVTSLVGWLSRACTVAKRCILGL